MDKGEIKVKPEKESMKPVRFLVNDDFLTATQWTIAVDYHSDKAAGRFGKEEKS